MNVYMDRNAHKYAALAAKSAGDCFIPFPTQLLVDVLELAGAPLGEEILISTLQTMKDASSEEQQEFADRLADKRALNF